MKNNKDGFEGFFKETLGFFTDLKSNNNKEWFTQNQKSYEEYVLNPAREFIVAMGQKLAKISPEINADPRVNKSLFKINRDVRFSSDKSPYKTNLGIVFWDADLPRMESSVFYMHLEISDLMLGAGIYKFTKPQLGLYRQRVAAPRYGKELLNLYNSLSGKGYSFGGKNFKKIPKGYDTLQENSHFLLYDGLYVYKDFDIPDVFFASEFTDFCFKYYSEMLPVKKWLSEMIAE